MHNGFLNQDLQNYRIYRIWDVAVLVLSFSFIYVYYF